MNAERREQLDTITQILTLVAPLIPGAGPYATLAVTVLPQIKQLFTKAGGDGETFDALMAESRANIDQLAHPDAFFGFKRVVQPPTPTPRPHGPYNAVLLAYPKRSDYLAMDAVYQNGDSAEWVVMGAREPGIGKPQAPWRLVETFE